jgi:hypothetical protein
MTDSFVGSVELTNIVAERLTWLRDQNEDVQKRGIKILSALAQTGKHILRHLECDPLTNSLAAGEQAITPHVIDMVKMLLPPPDRSPVPRSQLFVASAILHNLCRNGKSRAVLPRHKIIIFCSNPETLRAQIKNSGEYALFKRLRTDSTLYPSN